MERDLKNEIQNTRQSIHMLSNRVIAHEATLSKRLDELTSTIVGTGSILANSLKELSESTRDSTEQASRSARAIFWLTLALVAATIVSAIAMVVQIILR